MSQERVARLLTIPASVSLLCGLSLRPPKLLLPRMAAVKPAKVAVRKPARKALPRLAAVDRHIAKRVNDLRPSVKVRLAKVVARLPKGVTLLVTSAARTRAEQASLHSTFGVKARPGTSCHEDGRAVDLNVLVDGERIPVRMQNRLIGSAMASEGFQYLGPRDPVHYSVPKSEIDPTLLHGPELSVSTMADLRELALENSLALQPAVVASSENPLSGVARSPSNP